jgi:hypothetical protein
VLRFAIYLLFIAFAAAMADKGDVVQTVAGAGNGAMMERSPDSHHLCAVSLGLAIPVLCQGVIWVFVVWVALYGTNATTESPRAGFVNDALLMQAQQRVLDVVRSIATLLYGLVALARTTRICRAGSAASPLILVVLSCLVQALLLLTCCRRCATARSSARAAVPSTASPRA